MLYAASNTPTLYRSLPVHTICSSKIIGICSVSMTTSRTNVGHLHFFTQETAIATLEDCGYEIIDGFLTTSFDSLPAKSVKAKIARPLRRLSSRISPRWSVRLLGGYSYIVLAR
jgi:hypothetical protein